MLCSLINTPKKKRNSLARLAFVGVAFTIIAFGFLPMSKAEDLPAVEGEKAPDFALKAEDGKLVKLSDFLGKKVIVFFYGQDLTPVSKEEAKEIQKYYDKFKLLDTDVLGIGPDPVASHKAMATQLQLRYHLLTDKDDQVRKLFKLSAEKGRYGVIIDKNGLIKKISGTEGHSVGYISDIYDYMSSFGGGI